MFVGHFAVGFLAKRAEPRLSLPLLFTFVVSVVVYVRGTRTAARFGTIGFWAFVGTMVVAWLSGVFGPPPPSIQVVAWSALVFVPLTLLRSWAIDRARPPRQTGHTGRR